MLCLYHIRAAHCWRGLSAGLRRTMTESGLSDRSEAP